MTKLYSSYCGTGKNRTKLTDYYSLTPPSPYWKLHRLDGPAVIHYDRKGRIQSEEYFKEEKLHREDGPAIIHYDRKGRIQSEEYFKNNRNIRKDGPAKIVYYKNGNISYEIFVASRINKKISSIYYDKKGNITKIYWRYRDNCFKLKQTSLPLDQNELDDIIKEIDLLFDK